MKNIKYLTILSLIVFSFNMNAQTGKIKKGEKSYEAYSYSECINKFEGISDKTYAINKKLAESYYKTADFKNAEKYYSEIAKSSESTSEDVYNYASVLAVNEKYPEYEQWMDKFSALEKEDKRAKLHIQNKGMYNFLLKDKEQFKIKNIDVNTKQEDFGTAYYLDKVVFASSRSGAKLIKRIWNWNKLAFLDLYIADNKKSELANPKKFKRTFNKKFHEGPASYSEDGNFSAFTRNNYEGKSKEGIVKLKIFTSEKENKKWKKPVPVHFNSSEYSVGHPSLTADGKKMYFASDMPGGYGGVDIYVVERTENGEWGTPKNLGSKINTEGNEMFPFIHEKEGMLFYSSNGLTGLGGLDIFLTYVSGNSFSLPKNLGVPINSSHDDFALILDKEMKRGFFSSNREDGKGDDDIYSFKVLKPFTRNVILKGTAKDTKGKILANADVSLFNLNGDLIKKVSSDENGNYEFDIEKNKEYKLEGEKLKYVTDIEEFDSNTDKLVIIKDLTLEKLPDFTLLCNVSDNKTNKPISGVNVSIIDNNKNLTKTDNTLSDGNFLIKLPDSKLNDNLNYTFSLTKDGYAPKTVSYSELIDHMGEYRYDIKMNKIEIGEDLGRILEINPIYFDLDKSYIRSDAKDELNHIVNIMNEYPNMVIELSSHTDCRQTTIYNRKLSDRRAKESANYIKRRITKPSRIYGSGYGESRLTNNCPCEGGQGAGLNCTEEQHQQNRRTEFKIIRK